MPLLKVRPFVTGSSSSGISILQSESRGRSFWRLGLTRAAQEAHFGRALDIEADYIELIVTNDPKLNHLLGIRVVPVGHPDAMKLSSAPHGSVGLRVAPWAAIAKGKRGAVSLPVVNPQVAGGGISVKLPEWARPEPDRRMASGSGLLHGE